MAVDVIIDPLTGQIYWNDSQNTAQSIAISGNGTDLIKLVGYSLQFTAAPVGTITAANNTTTITGSGTNFTTLFGSGAAANGAILYTVQGTSIGVVSSVTNDTTLVLQANANGNYNGINFKLAPPSGTERIIFSDSSTPLYPATTGSGLGSASYRWSLFASDINASGNLTLTNALTVLNGGTGTSSLPSNTILIGAGSSIPTFASGTAAQYLVANSSNTPTFVSLSGDVTSSSTGLITIQASSISTSKILDGSVTTNKILDLNVTEGKINTSAISTTKILDGAVTTNKILDLNVTEAKINTSAISTTKILDGAITTNKILDSNVTFAKLENGSANSVLGRSTNSSGVNASISASTDGHVLRLSGTTLGFGALNLSSSNALTGRLPIASGGTGTTVFSIDKGLVYYSTSSSSFITTNNAANQVLVSDASGLPQFAGNLDSNITIGSKYIYRADGTDVPITDGGTGGSTATSAINNLLPSQSSNGGKYLTTDGSNVSWATVSAGGSGTVNSGTANRLAYYSGATTTDSDASLVRSATGSHLTITSQSATVSPLELVGAAAQSANYFNIKNASGGSIFTILPHTNSTNGALNAHLKMEANSNDGILFDVTNNNGRFALYPVYGASRGVRMYLSGSSGDEQNQYIISVATNIGNQAFGVSARYNQEGVGICGADQTAYPLGVNAREDSSTSSVKDVISIQRTTSGTAAAGIGARLLYRIENAGGTLVPSGAIDGVLSNASTSAYSGALVFNTNTAGSTTFVERVRITNAAVQLSPIGTSAGNTNELRFLELAANGTNYTAFKAPDSLSAEIIYTLPSTGPSANQVLSASTVSGTSVTLGWATASSGGSGTISTGTINVLAYYSGANTTASATGLVYAASGDHLIITSQGAAITPLRLVAASGQSANLFEVANVTDKFVIDNSGNVSTGTWQGSIIGRAYGGTGTSATPGNGQLLIGNGSAYTVANLTEGGGVGVTNSSGSITLRSKRVVNIVLASGLNPTLGADTAIVRIPESPSDGTTSLTYNIRRLQCRVETPSSGTTTFQVQYSASTTAFSGSNLLTSAMSVTGTSNYEFSMTSASFSPTTLSSGAKLRLNFSAVDSTHAYFSINLLLEES